MAKKKLHLKAKKSDKTNKDFTYQKTAISKYNLDILDFRLSLRAK